MGRITQRFNGLQPDIAHGMPGRHHIHNNHHAARLQDALNLTQRLANIMPVMGRIAAYHHIKAGIGKRQRFSIPLLGSNIGETFIFCGFSNHLQHLAR